MRKNEDCIAINVIFLGYLRAIVNKDEDVVEIEKNATVENLLQKLTTKYGEEFRKRVFTENCLIKENVQLLINGKTLRKHKEALGHMLTKEAILTILPIASGG
jgi:MoaD family protein